MSRILKGKEVAEKILRETSEKIEKIKEKGVIPTLAIVRTGENPGDMSYERGAVKRAFEAGIMAKSFVYEEDISQEDFLSEVKKLNEDPYIHGILIFRPLPAHIDDKAVCGLLDCSKDIDGITAGSMAGVFMNEDIGYPPCTAEACMELLDYYGIDLEEKKVTVLGRSLVIGKPAAVMVMNKNATVTVCHSRTKNEDLKAAGKNADVIISALGKAKMIDSNIVGENQIILDVGINVKEDGSLCGDVDFEDVCESAEAITPVPGGIGSVTTAVLIKHVAEAAEKAV